MPISPFGPNRTNGASRPENGERPASHSSFSAQSTRVKLVALAAIGLLAALLGKLKSMISRLIHRKSQNPSHAPFVHAQRMREHLAQCFPLRAETFEELRISALALEELEVDLSRANVCICGQQLHTLADFHSALSKTPFIGNAEQIAQMLCQKAMAPTATLTRQHAMTYLNAHRRRGLGEISIAMQSIPQSPLRIDFFPNEEEHRTSGSWRVEGEKSCSILAISNDFENGLEVSPCLTLGFRVEIPVANASLSTWTDLRFTHFIHLGQSTSDLLNR